MPNTHVTKNYFAHGGDTLVIGGRLTFLEGATVEGGEDSADSTATSASGLKEDFNALLAKLRTAGLMPAEAPAEPPAETPDQGEGGGT